MKPAKRKKRTIDIRMRRGVGTTIDVEKLYLYSLLRALFQPLETLHAQTHNSNLSKEEGIGLVRRSMVRIGKDITHQLDEVRKIFETQFSDEALDSIFGECGSMLAGSKQEYDEWIKTFVGALCAGGMMQLLSVEQCRKHLPKDYTDEQIAGVRDNLYQLAKIAIDQYLKKNVPGADRNHAHKSVDKDRPEGVPEGGFLIDDRMLDVRLGRKPDWKKRRPRQEAKNTVKLNP